MTEDRAHGGHGQAREILRLAVPAFLALVAEPLFLLADSAIVGNLGTAAIQVGDEFVGVLISTGPDVAHPDEPFAHQAELLAVGFVRVALGGGLGNRGEPLAVGGEAFFERLVDLDPAAVLAHHSRKTFEFVAVALALSA